MPCRDLRALFCEQRSPMQKLIAVKKWLVGGLAGRVPQRKPLTVHALTLLQECSVRDTARRLSVSERRLHQVFKTEVGLSPKLCSRVQRFQHGLRRLQDGAACTGMRFLRPVHFCNEFSAFSGIDLSTYTASPRLWPNHVPEQQP